MPALIESETSPITPFDVAEISRTLAEDLSRLVFRTEGITVDDYFSLDGSYFVEYVDGQLQVLPIPDAVHQAVTFVLMSLIDLWLECDVDGRVIMSPFKIRLNDRLYREPDIAVMLGLHADRRTRQFWRGADLVVEVISETNRRHDVMTKMGEYAVAEIPEYWIVDPEEKIVSVFVLNGSQFEATESNKVAVSRVMPGLIVDVKQLFIDAEKRA